MKVTALAGGVGAAKLVSGLAALVPARDLSVIVNTGDDFGWMGLYICPDLDTIIYTLAGLAHPVNGWGLAADSFHCLERLRLLGSDTWFRIGDRDLATHIFRTQRLHEGQRLSEVTAAVCSRSGVHVRVLPMTDSPVPTHVDTDRGTLDFQEYFVRLQCTPRIFAVFYSGVDRATAPPPVLEAIGEADAVILCPSNPWLSIGPILAVPGIRESLRATRAKTLAVSPIVAGKALKGPAAAMMSQLGLEVSAAGVAGLYRDFLDIFVMDGRDQLLRGQVAALGLEARIAETIMDTPASRVSLAHALLEILG